MALFFAVMTAATLALAAAVAYGVIRHRVIDVSFAVSRTVVYTILTGIVVALFTLVDFVSSKFLEHLQFTIVLEAAAALAFGLWLNTLHSRVDRFVDRVLFRQRHLAEERLKRAARTLAHGDACDFVDDMLVLEATDALSLASAAVFREDAEGIYRRTCARGWQPEDCSELHTGDHLMVTLRAELRTIILRDVRLDDAAVPEGLAHPLLAVPLVVRHRPIGVVFYSGHTGGEAIDADEKRVLEALCEAAAGAYEHIRAAEIVREADGLRAENSVLKHDTALLREVLDGLRAPQPRKAPGARIEEKVI